jgi:UDP-N-acetylglucosamine acyltransferase
VTRDVLPYSLVKGDRAMTVGLNVVGLKRLGWSDNKIATLTNSMVKYFQTGHEPAIDNSEEVKKIVDFIKTTKRGICNMKALPKVTTDGSKI